MITVYAFEPGFGMPSASPFVTKVLVLLKMAELPFGIEITQDLGKAPKGKLPYIRDENDVIGDSDVIRRHLQSRHGVDFDRGLDPTERATGLALTRLAEEHLYWCLMYHHWQIDQHWLVIKEMFFGAVPAERRDQVAQEVRTQVLRDLHGHGMGRHSHDEMLDFARADLQALADILGDRPFLFGTEPTSADAAIAPQLVAIAADSFDAPLNRAIHDHPRLVDYGKRVLATYFPD